jgi:hypothetical protein
MTSEPSKLMPPDQIVPALTGERGGDLQFEQMKLFVVQYVGDVMSRAGLSVGAGVALSEGLNQPFIYEP